MRYLILGLGIYGENLARDLAQLGHEVIGADINPANVENLKDTISTVYQLDASEESALAALPLRNVDLVIVAIGENFGASIKTVALLKQAGVKHIYARAIDKLHEAILRSFEIDRILTPEQHAAENLVLEMEMGTSLRTLDINGEQVVIAFDAPTYFIGLPYSELIHSLKANYDITFIAAGRPVEKRNILGLSRPALAPLDISGQSVTQGDTVTIFGAKIRIRELIKKW